MQQSGRANKPPRMGANGNSESRAFRELVGISQDLSEVKQYISPFQSFNVLGILKKKKVEMFLEQNF